MNILLSPLSCRLQIINNIFDYLALSDIDCVSRSKVFEFCESVPVIDHRLVILSPSGTHYLDQEAFLPSTRSFSFLDDTHYHLSFISYVIGWGLYASKLIPKGTILFIYSGEMINSKEATNRRNTIKRSPSSRRNFILTVREHFEGGVLVTNVDAENIGGGYSKYINHSCSPNLMVFMIREREKLCGIPALKTLRTIGRGEQLTFDYGGGDMVAAAAAGETKGNVKKCLCGSKKCRGSMPFSFL